jgi:hypothetical protein
MIHYAVFQELRKTEMLRVLYSPGYGAGWSTWNDATYRPSLTTHRDIVQCVLDGDRCKAAEVAEKLVRDVVGDRDLYVCVLGADDLEVRWCPVCDE